MNSIKINLKIKNLENTIKYYDKTINENKNDDFVKVGYLLFKKWDF